MDSEAAVYALAALAQGSRLAVFRALVRAGPSGIAPGDLAEALAIPSSTLSFHLQHLTSAGLAKSARKGRSLVYSLRAESLRDLLWFLGEDCCQGRTDLCAVPTARIEAKRKEATESLGRPRVLFVCSRNSARSQMAEAILRREAKERFEVCSAGIAPRDIDPMTLRVLDEAGFETRGLASKDLGKFLGKQPIHYAIIVCEAASSNCPQIVPFARDVLFWPFPDPMSDGGSSRERLRRFREVRDAIGKRIRTWLKEQPWERDRKVRARMAAR